MRWRCGCYSDAFNSRWTSAVVTLPLPLLHGGACFHWQRSRDARPIVLWASCSQAVLQSTPSLFPCLASPPRSAAASVTHDITSHVSVYRACFRHHFCSAVYTYLARWSSRFESAAKWLSAVGTWIVYEIV